MGPKPEVGKVRIKSKKMKIMTLNFFFSGFLLSREPNEVVGDGGQRRLGLFFEMEIIIACYLLMGKIQREAKK